MSDEPVASTPPRSEAEKGFQFSLLQLFVLMSAVAVALGSMAGLANLLGVNLSGSIMTLIGWIITQLPTYIVWLVAIVMLVNRSARHPRASRLGIVGFGGLLLLSVLGMGFQWLVQAALSSGQSMASFGWIFSIYSLFHSIIAAICHACLLAAILAWRSEPNPVMQRRDQSDGAGDMKRDTYDRDG